MAEEQTEALTKFTIELYGPSEQPGFVRHIGNVTYGELKKQVKLFIDKMEGNELHGEFGYEWIEVGNYGSEGVAIPNLEQVFVTSYTGANEGYKVEIAGIDKQKKYHSLLVIKTFEPRARCFDLACKLSKWMCL